MGIRIAVIGVLFLTILFKPLYTGASFYSPV
jgi:hypothetical protein